MLADLASDEPDAIVVELGDGIIGHYGCDKILADAEILSKTLGFSACEMLALVLAPAAYGSLELAVAVSMVALLVVDFGLGPTAALRRNSGRGRLFVCRIIDP